MDGVSQTLLKRISHPKGDILHVLKVTDLDFAKFGEAYFTTVHYKNIKGWRKHSQMELNLVVPVGNVKFYIHDSKSGETQRIIIGEDNYQRLHVKPGLWVAFEGLNEGLNLVLNIASIAHDPSEAENLPIEAFTL